MTGRQTAFRLKPHSTIHYIEHFLKLASSGEGATQVLHFCFSVWLFEADQRFLLREK